jgi:two-component system, chemotaxis family, chemotaxis protein CheY
MTAPRVLSVGQCGYDHGRLTRFVRDAFAAQVEGVDSADEALAALRSGSYQLVLVNRELDGDGSSGLDLIRTVKADPALAVVPAMLVSNYPEAQAEAIALGAVAGFGKADLGRPRAREAVSPILAPAPVSDHSATRT